MPSKKDRGRRAGGGGPGEEGGGRTAERGGPKEECLGRRIEGRVNKLILVPTLYFVVIHAWVIPQSL